MKAKILVFLGAIVFVLAGCGGKSTSVQSATTQQTISQLSREWQSDGVIADGEYTAKQKIGEIEVSSRVAGDSVMIGMRARTSGWMALGFDPENKMKGADIQMGYLENGKAFVVDMYSTGTFGPHPADESQGGTSDNTMISGTQQDGFLVIEFKRRLNTGDSKDKTLKLGENKVIWSIGESKDIAAQHSRRGYGTLTLQ